MAHRHARFGAISGLTLAMAGAAWLSPGSAPARADSTDSGQVVLQLRFKQGDVLKYQTNMQLGVSLPVPASSHATGGAAGSSGAALGGTTFTVSAMQELTVRRAAPGGGGDVDVTTTGQNSLPGQPPILSNDTRPVTMTYDAQGKLTGIRRQRELASTNIMFSSMLGQGLLSMQGIVLPARPVKVGETWTEKVAIPGVTGASASVIKTTLTRIENVNRYRTAHLHVVITTPVNTFLDAALQPTSRAADAACTATGTAVVTDEINFALAEGRVIRSVGKGVTNMTVTVGRPAAPPKPARKKGAPAGPAQAPARPQQVLKMSVRTDIDTNLVEGAKK